MSASIRFLQLPLVACLLLTAAGTQAATYTVGASAGCTHSTISAAFSAAHDNPGPDVIRVTRDQSYTQQALDFWILQGELTLTGGYASCFSDFSDGIPTVLDGAGGSARPVLKILNTAGTVVRIQYLTLRGGDAEVKGGGIYYAGGGSLHLANSALINNTADLGGGLYAEGHSAGTEVVIHSNVTISGNVARLNGGGVFAEGLTLHMTAPDSLIAFNHAEGGTVLGVPVGGYGGGLVINPRSGQSAYAYIGGTGVGNLGIIHGNSARHGGGIAVLGESGIQPSAYLYLYTTDPARPAAVRDNFASVTGGGLHLQPRHVFDGSSSYATAYLWNAYIEGNVAPDAAAAYVGQSTNSLNETVGGNLYFNRFRPAGAAPCPTGIACGVIADNQAEDANGQATNGAVIRQSEDSIFEAHRIGLYNNSGGRLFDLEGGEDRVYLDLRNVLIQGNFAGLELIRAQDEPQVAIVDSTIGQNNIGAGHVLAVSDEFILKNSILWQPGKTSLLCGGCSRMVEWTIASEAVSLGGGPGAVVMAPRFLDPDRGDLQLRAASPAIDYAPPIADDDRDVLNRSRDQRLPQVPRPDPSRTRDSGAFERQSVQPLVLNGQFAGDLNLWTPHNDPAVYSTENAPNSPAGTGSAYVGGTSTSSTMYGAFHCVHLPGPGTYRLNGWSRSSGALPSERNPVALRWEFRPDGGEGCIDGTITVAGEPLLHGGSDWGQPPAPAYIHIPESEWTHNNTLTVVLAVHSNGSTSFNGWFDNISLEFGSDVIFANDFEL